MGNKLRLFVLLSCLTWGISAMTQNVKHVVGVVKDASGETLPGVLIKTQGEKMPLAQTDSDGNFALDAEKGQTLTFSYIGMKDYTIRVGDSDSLNVVLQSDIHTMKEVVVTGVGTPTERRKLGISVESVSGKELSKTPVSSIDDALSGKIAGAQIFSTSGQLGQQSNIILRGINSVTSTQPMILVDGVEINAGNSANGGSGNLSSRLADLDLSNVDRVEVIQGAAAATIYGAQGANGVIQIFTKRGRQGMAPQISVSTSIGTENTLRGKLKFANNHYFDTDAEGYIVDALGKRIAVDPATGLWTLPSRVVSATSTNDKPYKEQTYDHLKQYFRSALSSRNSINITGATGKVDYALGGSYLYQESTVNGSYNRKNINSNIGIELFKGFTLRSSTQLISSKNTAGGINNVDLRYATVAQALRAFPFVDLKYRDGLGNPFVHYDSGAELGVTMPFYSYAFKTSDAGVKRVIQTIQAHYRPLRQLEFDYKFGYDHYRYNYNEFIANQKRNAVPDKGLDPLAGRLTETAITETQQNSLLSAYVHLDFQKDFKLNVPIQSTTQLSYDWRKREYKAVTSEGNGFTVEPPHTLSTANTTSSYESGSEFVTFGYLINQKFDYANLAGISFGIRSDYSSAFGRGSKPFTFPRADAYFRFSELLKSNTLYELKLRAAYGEAGIQPGVYDRLITLKNGTLGSLSYLYVPFTSQNADLDVERNKEFELGLDYGLSLNSGNWLHKVSGSVVYWTRKSIGTIYEVDSPSSPQGAIRVKDNAIDLTGHGLQLALDADMYRSESTKWSLGLRFATSVTKVDHIAGGKRIVLGSNTGSGQTSLIEGERVGTFIGFRPLTSLDEVKSDGSRYIAEADRSKYEIVEGMVVESATKRIQFTSEKEKIGQADPKFTLSWLNDLTLFKNFTCSFQLDWVYGSQIYNATKQWLYTQKNHADFDNSVTIGGQIAPFVAFRESMYNNGRTNSLFVESGSYLRLRTLSLSYDFTSLLKSSIVRNLVVTLSAHNLFTITPYSGLDPEAVGTSLNNPLYRGIDLWSLPNTRSYNLAVNINF